jgi:cytoskeletal protein CcmA (bactofilin family)
MAETTNPAEGEGQDKSGSPSVVPLGSKMPAQAKKLPVLGTPQREGTEAAQPLDESQLPRSEIAEGMNFVGDAVLTGVCTIKGRVQGNLKQAGGAKITVVVTESGHVKGDIVADQISVMGRTEGLLDATGGSVSLHDTANVSGHVRYFRLQVNGSELNATLERAPSKSAPPQAGAGAAPAGMPASQLVQAAQSAQRPPGAQAAQPTAPAAGGGSGAKS